MKKLTLLLVILTIISCGKKEADLTVTGTIKGLKKGTVYLQQLRDSSLVVLDSMVINGEQPFTLQSDLVEPEVLLLMLNKNSSEDSRIAFFADKGVTEINTTLKNFVVDAEINGSEQQKTLEEYQSIMSRLNGRNLDLIKENFEAQKAGDSVKLDTIQKQYDNVIKRKYLYTVNFAINNKYNFSILQ